MGTKINSLFVRLRDAARVGDALRAIGDDVPEVDLAIVPAGDWTAIFADDLDDLEAVCEPLSSRVGASVVHVRMLDGDATQMCLFADGDELAWLATPPREWGRRSVGRAAPWAGVLGSDAAAESILREWRRPPRTLEELVTSTARELGIDTRLATRSVHALDPAYPGRIDVSIGSALGGWTEEERAALAELVKNADRATEESGRWDAPGAPSGPAALTAWVLLDATHEEAVACASEVILAFHALVNATERTVYRRFSAGGSTRPRYSHVPAPKLSARAIAGWLKKTTSVLVMLDHGDPQLGVPQDSAGVELANVFTERALEHAVPHVGISFSTRMRTPEEIDVLERELVALVDRLAATFTIRQAFVDRRDDAPLCFDSTSYELSREVSGQCTTSSWWVDQWLRSVAPHLWVGSPLARRVDRRALEKIARAEDLPGGVLRVSAEIAPGKAWERRMLM